MLGRDIIIPSHQRERQRKSRGWRNRGKETEITFKNCLERNMAEY